MSNIRHVANRHMLPVEMLVACQLGGWSFVATNGSGPVHAAIVAHGAVTIWWFTFMAFAMIRFSAALTEFVLGAYWSDKSLMHWAGLRGTIDVLVFVLLLYFLSIIFQDVGFVRGMSWSINCMGAMVMTVWGCIENFLVKAYLDPNHATPTLHFDR